MLHERRGSDPFSRINYTGEEIKWEVRFRRAGLRGLIRVHKASASWLSTSGRTASIPQLMSGARRMKEHLRRFTVVFRRPQNQGWLRSRGEGVESLPHWANSAELERNDGDRDSGTSSFPRSNIA